MQSILIDIAGQRFGRLTAIRRDGSVGRKAAWLCQCDCGGFIRAIGVNLRNGNTQSCRCVRRNPRVTAGRHYAERSPTLQSWMAMHARCTYPSHVAYHRYGGRGITICERWADFSNFLADMGERPEGRSLDRIDCDGSYEPSNCRWATPKEQANNRSKLHRGAALCA